jgi:hypothetical protein
VKYSKLFSALFACALSYSASAITQPDEIDFVTSDDPGYQTVIASWGNRVYQLKIKGRVQDPENKEQYDQWFEQVMEKEDEAVRHH